MSKPTAIDALRQAMQHDGAPRRWWITGLFAIAVVMPLFRGMGWLRERIRT
jgi:hypothetical protein